MFEEYTVNVLSVRDYERATEDYQRAILPRTAGIYVWTLDLTQFARPVDDDIDPETLLEQMHERLQRRVRNFTGRIDPYVEVTLVDAPIKLTDATRQRLEGIAACRTPLIEWSLLCATLFQRPLYVGKARRLDRRIRQHLKEGSTMRTYLSEAGLVPRDCTVILAPIRRPAEVDDTSADDAGLFGEDAEASDLRDDEFAEDIAEPEPLFDDVTETAQVDRLIRLAESLVIRSSRPLFNARQD